jgi:hypothetical protein
MCDSGVILPPGPALSESGAPGAERADRKVKEIAHCCHPIAREVEQRRRS